MIGLDLVTATVQIKGKRVDYVSLTLRQAFNQHHIAEICVDYEELDSNWMKNPISLIKLIGEEAIITFSHRESSDSNDFIGIITDVSAVGSHGEQGQYVIKVKSPTILLDGERTVDSFTQKSLPAIVNEIVSNSGNGAEVNVAPHYKSSLPYFCQYRESGFEVLNRLSWLYNESFYYTGKEILFGAPQPPGEFDLTYGIDLSEFNFSAHLAPSNFTRYAYLDHEDRDKRIPAPGSINEADGYLLIAQGRSDAIYTSPARLPVPAVTDTTNDVQDLIREDKIKTLTNMVSFSGSSNSCRVKLGEIAHISLHKNMKADMKSVGDYIVTEVVHMINQQGYYENRFIAFPAGFNGYSFVSASAFPVAMPEIATVVANDHENGRVKVKFKWHEINNKESEWMRVQTPDAGSSDDVTANRGMVFIPEIDDQVMVHFIDGDPSRPYVNGSMFREGIGKGGHGDNQQKSIITRSGIKIVFNDNEKSLRIEDPSGNSWLMDGKGNITVIAPETISFKAKNIDMAADENVTVSAGEDIQQSAGKNMTETAGETHLSQAKNSQVQISENSYTEIKKDMVTNVGAKSVLFVEDNINLSGGKVLLDVLNSDFFVNVTGKITFKSGDIIDIA